MDLIVLYLVYYDAQPAARGSTGSKPTPPAATYAMEPTAGMQYARSIYSHHQARDMVEYDDVQVHRHLRVTPSGEVEASLTYVKDGWVYTLTYRCLS